MGTREQNTSGQGRGAQVPVELRGWNWGAFLLNWIWGLGNNTFIALLMFVPLVNVVMLFVLGVEGNAWAWRNRRWRSVAHFRAIQRKWALSAVVVYALSIALIAGVGVQRLTMLRDSGAYRLSADLLKHDNVTVAVFGLPMETGFPRGGVETRGVQGRAAISYAISGPKASGTVYVEATKADDKWTLRYLQVKIEGYSQRLILIPAPPVE